MSNIGFALELHNTLEKPVNPALLAAVRAAGFDFVLLHSDLHADAATASAILKETGLKPIAIALSSQVALQYPEKCLSLAETFGVPDIALFLDGPQLLDDAKLVESIEEIRKAALLFEGAGFRLLLGFRDMAGLDYAAIIQRFAIEQAPELVGFLPDTCEISRAQNTNPASIVRSLPDRCPLLALGDIAEDTGIPCAIGEGCLDWDTIFDAGEEAAVEWYVCRAPGTPMDMGSATKSLAYLAARA